MQKEIKLNIAQMYAVMAMQKNISLELGRGTGKSTILAWYVRQAVETLPRATGILVGSSYVQILSRTWPSTKEGLEMFGLYEDMHYVVGRNGKKLGFKPPFQAPNKWHNVIHFYSGFILVLVSLEDPNSGRGLNSYIVIGDEATLFDPKRLFDNVSSTNRATKPQFKDNPLLNAEIYASSTAMTAEGRWFTDLEKNAESYPDNYFHLRANALVNAMNLSKDWFARMKERASSITQYNAEILNIRPQVTEKSFYPQISPKKHYYTQKNGDIGVGLVNAFGDKIGASCYYDKDINPLVPIIISTDWGASINSMTVSQEIDGEYRIVKEFWVKSPKILDDLFIDEFLPYFKRHQNKTIEFYYDRNGNSRVANSRLTYSEQAVNILKKNGWKVKIKTPETLDPSHMAKFRVVNALLRHSGELGWPRILINRLNCPDTIISLENAPAKEGTKGIQKDKKSERSKTLQQQFATHLSDTVDLPLYWKYAKLVDRLLMNKVETEIVPLL